MRERNRNAGFTLIEMMIVAAVVGVLAAVAVPAYRHYVARAKISEGLILAQPLRRAVVEFYGMHGHLPVVANNNWHTVLTSLNMPSSAGGAASGRYVKRIWWHNNAKKPAIRIRYAGGELEDKLLYLTAEFGSGAISWHCKSPSRDGVPPADRPASCRE